MKSNFESNMKSESIMEETIIMENRMPIHTAGDESTPLQTVDGTH